MTKEVKVDNKLKRKKRIIVLLITILLLSILFIVLLTQTTFFHVKEIEVNGNFFIEKDKVLTASGINNGENIFRLSIDDIEDNLLRHPYIKQVKIDRKFPNKVMINLVERKETLVYEMNGTYIIMDNEGYVLNILSEFKNKEITSLKGDIQLEVKTSEKVDFEKYSWLKETLNLLSFCNDNDFSFNITSILLENKDITLVLNSGTYIAFGGLNDIEYKLRLTNEIVNDLQKKEIFAKEIQLNKGKNPIIVK